MFGKKLLLCSCLFSLIAFANVGTATSGVITFDPFPTLPADVSVEYFDNGLTGVVNVLPTANNVELIETDSAIPFGGSALWLTGLDKGVPFVYGALFTFDTLQSYVSAVGNDFGGNSVNDNEIVYLSLFDSLGGFLGSAMFSSDWAEPNLKPVSFTSLTSNIKYAAFTYTNDLGYYAVDNITYRGQAPVPEPATMLLFGTGLAGLAAVGRRKKVS